MLIIPEKAPRISKSKLSEGELAYYLELEAEFKRQEEQRLSRAMTTNTLQVAANISLRNTIRQTLGIIQEQDEGYPRVLDKFFEKRNSVPSQRQTELKAMPKITAAEWNAELELERSNIEQHNKAMVKRLKPKSKFY